MCRLLRVLLAFLLTGLLSCSTEQSSHKDPANVKKLDDFEKALGLYAQGLLAFEESPKEGLSLLKEALLLSPYEQKMVDDFYVHTHKKVIKDSFLDTDVSDHDKLHGLLIRDFREILDKFTKANYVRLKLLESYLALDRGRDAQALLQEEGLEEDEALILANVRFLRATNNPKLSSELKKLLSNPKYSQDFQLQLIAIRYLMEKEPYENAEQMIEHAKQLLESLPESKREDSRDLPFTLIDAFLYGSDIGETARSQSIEGIDYGDITSQWSLLAGVLMKLEMYEEAYKVLKKRIITNVRSRWRACLSLAICCQKLDKDKERIQYLEEAYSIRPTSSYTSKSLLVTYLTEGDLEGAFRIYEEIKNPADFWLAKIHFYLLSASGKFQSAFTVAEEVYTWKDVGKRITGMTSSFASGTIPVYLKVGRPELMEKRLQQAIKYLPNNMNLLNSLAYQYAEEDYNLVQAEKWIDEVFRKGPVTGSFADTYAWVLFKQKRYKEAKKYIDQAMDISVEKSAEILLHAGDIYQKLGYRTKARNFWTEALGLDPELKSEIEDRMNKNENSVD